MLSTILAESCFTQAHTPVTLLLVAQGPIVQLGNTTQILIRAAAQTLEPAMGGFMVHLTGQFAQRVMPRARPATVRLRATARRVIAPDLSRTSTTDGPGTSATSALRTRIAAQARFAQTMRA